MDPLPPSPPPWPPQQLSYASYTPPPLDPRPTSVKVIAIIAIIFGSFGVLGGVCSLPQYMGLQIQPNPVIDGVRQDAVLFSITIASLIVYLALGAMELSGGIGALKARPWARPLLIWYAVLNIATTLIGMALNLTIMHARMDAVVRKAIQTSPQLNTPGMQSILRYSQIGGIISSIVFLIWPALILYYLTRPRAKEVFSRGMGPMGSR